MTTDKQQSEEESLRVKLEEFAKSHCGIWWWADEVDNPFGIALLTCPQVYERKAPGRIWVDRKDFPYVYLYTFNELDKKVKVPLLIARKRKHLIEDLIGWPIFKDNKKITWTLPKRFESQNNEAFVNAEKEKNLARIAYMKTEEAKRARKANKKVSKKTNKKPKRVIRFLE